METSTGWLSAEGAARHLGMGKTALYERAREGRIPAQKIGDKWVFERSALDDWMRSQGPMDSFFLDTDFSIEHNDNLRSPQRDGYVNTYDFFNSGKNRAIIRIPVGCRKTGLATLLPFGSARGRVIVIAPNLTIKKSLYDAMDITNKQKCFWLKTGVLSRNQTVSGPFACTLDTGNISVATKSHIVITNIQQLATNTDKWLMQFPDNFFDMIIVDEAHHSAATSWQKVIDRFPSAKVVLMTATPFRSDRKEIEGELVFRYSFRNATLKGYIKRLRASYVAPKKVELRFRDEQQRTYTLEEVQKLKEEDWFSRGIALARPCNEHIVDSSLEKLDELRQSGTQHQLIAVACSINHAREIKSLYGERGFTAEVIHSRQNDDEQRTIINKLRNGILDCIVQVQILGEGFDHPKLSVAAIFRPFRGLAPYIQFVGRIMRVIVQNNPTHPDNAGHIVTHLGMNMDERLKEFKQFENDDQAFWDKVISGDEPELPRKVLDGATRCRSEERVVVDGEIVDSLWEEDFIQADDQYLVEDLRERFKLLGLDPTHAEEVVKKARNAPMQKSPATAPFPIQPQRAWQEARKRLDEKAKRSANILLNNLNLSGGGNELASRYKVANDLGNNNYASAIIMINREIKNRYGIDRNQASAEELKQVSSSLDDILNALIKCIEEAKSRYEQTKN